MRPISAGDSPVPEAQKQDRVVRFGVFELDRQSGDLRKDGMSRPRLQGQPFDVLLQLLERPGEIVTREELRQRLRPADTFVDFDHSLNAAVNKLRDALEDSATNPRFVQTFARRGYRFIAPIEARQIVHTSESAAPIANAAPASHGAAELPRAKLLSDPRDLPEVPQKTARTLFSLIQLLYLGIYITALATLRIEDAFLSDRTDYATLLLAILVATASAGIAVRLYLLAAATFGFRGLARQFLRLFYAIFPLDELWALSPFLLLDRIGIGLVMAMIAALLFLPFAQRSILLMGDNHSSSTRRS
jgi:DNA-binding winged helix-turn-helix (wHTH) protein